MSLLLFLKEYLQIAEKGIPKNKTVRQKKHHSGNSCDAS